LTTQAHTSTSLIWPTALAGVLGAVVLVAAVLVAGPADAEPMGQLTLTVVQQ
jgi:hypothetical protein